MSDYADRIETLADRAARDRERSIRRDDPAADDATADTVNGDGVDALRSDEDGSDSGPGERTDEE